MLSRKHAELVGPRFLVLAGATAVCLLMGCGSNSHSVDEGSKTVPTVEMQSHSFEPSTITIHAGDTVLWKNKSLLTHTVTADPDLASDRSHVALPAGAQKFDSGKIGMSGTYAHIFTVPGTYRYVCLPHESKGMLGQVEVKPAGSP